MYSRQHKETIQICKHMFKNTDNMNMTRNSWHGFTTGKFCLTNVIALYDEMIGTVGKEKKSRMIYVLTLARPWSSWQVGDILVGKVDNGQKIV